MFIDLLENKKKHGSNENKKINWPHKKNMIHRKGEASILFDFFRWLLGGGGLLPILYISSINWLPIVSITTLLYLFQGDETHT